MLDLDVLSGEMGKQEKNSRDRGLSGERQSRILSGDVIDMATNPAEARARKSSQKKKSKGKLEIKGFIPIVSAEGASSKSGKQFGSLDGMTGDHEQEEDENEQEDSDINDQYQTQQSTKNQLLSNYGGQTSLGHASFPQQQSSSNDYFQQQQQNQQFASYDPQQNARPHMHTNTEFSDRARKLAMGAGLLTNPMRLVSNMVSGTQAPQHNGNECICVPFYQCKNGYLNEWSFGRSSPYSSSIYSPSVNQPMMQMQHVPRAINLNITSGDDQNSYQQLQHQDSHTISLMQLNNQHQKLQQPNLSPQEQQIIMEQIMDQLRRSGQMTTEMQQQYLTQQQLLNEQLQQQQQQDMSGSDQIQASGFGQLDERNAGGNKTLMGEGRSASANETNPVDSDVLERGFIRDLIGGPGRRSAASAGFASMNSGCGLMRTCCKPQSQHTSGNNFRGQFAQFQHQNRPFAANSLNQQQQLASSNVINNLVGAPSNPHSGALASIHLLNNHNLNSQQQSSFMQNSLHRPGRSQGLPSNLIGPDGYPIGTPCILARSAPGSSEQSQPTPKSSSRAKA